MSQASNKYTELNDRVLFFDGDTVADKQYLYRMLLSGIDISGGNICPIDMDNEISQYNDTFGNTLNVKQCIKKYDESWNIPVEYKNLDLKRKILDNLLTELSNSTFSDSEIKERIDRTQLEYKLWEKKDLINLLRTLLYIVDSFEDNSVVCSACAASSAFSSSAPASAGSLACNTHMPSSSW